VTKIPFEKVKKVLLEIAELLDAYDIEVAVVEEATDGIIIVLASPTESSSKTVGDCGELLYLTGQTIARRYQASVDYVTIKLGDMEYNSALYVNAPIPRRIISYGQEVPMLLRHDPVGLN
jgi:hypothetical protein